MEDELAIISKYMEAPIPPEVPSLIQIYTQLPTTVLKAQHITQMLEVSVYFLVYLLFYFVIN